MFNFLISNWDSALVVLIAIVVFFILYKRGSVKVLKQTLLYLVIKAEKEYGGGTGELKYSAVVSWLYDKLPSIVRFFITSKQIKKLIENAVIRMKEYLKENGEAKKLVE